MRQLTNLTILLELFNGAVGILSLLTASIGLVGFVGMGIFGLFTGSFTAPVDTGMGEFNFPTSVPEAAVDATIAAV